MSTNVPLPPLTEADVPAWVRLRRDKAGEPYLVVAWWPRLTRMELSTRSRPLSGGRSWDFPSSTTLLFAAALVVNTSSRQSAPAEGVLLRLMDAAGVVASGVALLTIATVYALSIAEGIALDRALARIHAARARRPAAAAG